MKTEVLSCNSHDLYSVIFLIRTCNLAFFIILNLCICADIHVHSELIFISLIKSHLILSQFIIHKGTFTIPAYFFFFFHRFELLRCMRLMTESHRKMFCQWEWKTGKHDGYSAGVTCLPKLVNSSLFHLQRVSLLKTTIHLVPYLSFSYSIFGLLRLMNLEKKHFASARCKLDESHWSTSSKFV